MQVRSVRPIILLLWMILAPALHAREDLQALTQQVEEHLHALYQTTSAERIELRVTTLDSRLNLPACAEPLQLNNTDSLLNGGNVSVHVRCPGPTPWAVYVPAQIALFRPVLVAARNLERGAILTEADLELTLHNTSLLRQGFLDDTGSAVGRELRRPINRGETLRAPLLDTPLAVRRGDEVVLEIQAGALSVVSTGTAMANGRVGQQIRVRNNQSQRIVSGEVVAPGRIRALF